MNNIDYAKIIKEKVKISEIISRDCNLIRTGSGFNALCPFHEEKTPSFVVNDDKESFNCFGCGRSGDVYTYIMTKHNIDFREALKFLASYVNLDINTPTSNYEVNKKNDKKKYFEIMSFINNFYQNKLNKHLQSKKIGILERKKIDKKLIDKFKIGLSTNSSDLVAYLEEKHIDRKSLIELGIFKENDNGNTFDLFKNRLMFPIIDKFNRVIAFGGRILEGEGPKYINSWENNFFKKREILYNLNGLQGINDSNKNIYLVEGYTDVIAMSKLEKYAVAPLGTSISLEQISTLWKYVDEPTIFLDGDKAGKMATKRLLDLTLPYLNIGKSLNFILLSENSDPEDIINSENGEQLLEEILNNKISFLETMMYLEKKNELDSPERLLGYKKRLFNKLRLIENEDVKKLYTTFLKKKLEEVINYSLDKEQNKYRRGNDTYFVKLAKEKSQIRFVLRRERSIVGAMINNFKLLQDYDEQLAKVRLSNSELSKLRDYIVEIISTQSINSSKELKELLIEKGFSKLIKKHLPTSDCINYNIVEKYAMETTDIKDAGKALMDLINIQEKWYNNLNKNLSNNFLKL